MRMKKGIIIASLILVIGLMGLGMADIDIPPVEEESFGGRVGIIPIMFAQQNQTNESQVNCTIIIVMMCNCTA